MVSHRRAGTRGPDAEPIHADANADTEYADTDANTGIYGDVATDTDTNVGRDAGAYQRLSTVDHRGWLMFWAMLLTASGLLSVASLNPIPFIAAVVLMCFGRNAESSAVAVVEAAGGSSDKPRGCMATLIAILLFCFVGMVALAAIVGILGE